MNTWKPLQIKDLSWYMEAKLVNGTIFVRRKTCDTCGRYKGCMDMNKNRSVCTAWETNTK